MTLNHPTPEELQILQLYKNYTETYPHFTEEELCIHWNQSKIKDDNRKWHQLSIDSKLAYAQGVYLTKFTVYSIQSLRGLHPRNQAKAS